MPKLDLSVTLLQGQFAKEVFKTLKSQAGSDYFLLEGRPSLSAVENNAKALRLRNITPTVISDNMAGLLFYKNFVKEVWLASQYQDQSGALCEIGALILAVLAKRHGIPIKLFPAAKKLRFLGNSKDLLSFKGKRIAPAGVNAFVPLVEWVPAVYLPVAMTPVKLERETLSTR